MQFQKEGAETRVKNKIKEAFRQSAELDADGIMVARQPWHKKTGASLNDGGSMQTRLKEEIDGDRAENYVSVTYYKNGQNKYEINCGACNKTLYTDKETSERNYRSIEQGLDNPFLCNDCEQEFEDLAYKDR